MAFVNFSENKKDKGVNECNVHIYFILINADITVFDLKASTLFYRYWTIIPKKLSLNSIIRITSEEDKSERCAFFINSTNSKTKEFGREPLYHDLVHPQLFSIKLKQ